MFVEPLDGGVELFAAESHTISIGQQKTLDSRNPATLLEFTEYGKLAWRRTTELCHDFPSVVQFPVILQPTRHSSVIRLPGRNKLLTCEFYAGRRKYKATSDVDSQIHDKIDLPAPLLPTSHSSAFLLHTMLNVPFAKKPAQLRVGYTCVPKRFNFKSKVPRRAFSPCSTFVGVQ
jgi:hypothetical protein